MRQTSQDRPDVCSSLNSNRRRDADIRIDFAVKWPAPPTGCTNNIIVAHRRCQEEKKLTIRVSEAARRRCSRKPRPFVVILLDMSQADLVYMSLMKSMHWENLYFRVIAGGASVCVPISFLTGRMSASLRGYSRRERASR